MIYANMEYKLTTSSKFIRYQSSDFYDWKGGLPPPLFLLYTTDKANQAKVNQNMQN